MDLLEGMATARAIRRYRPEPIGLPDDVVIAATICLGGPVGAHGPVRRRPVGELVFDDRWGESAPWAHDPPGTRFTSAGPPRPTRS